MPFHPSFTLLGFLDFNIKLSGELFLSVSLYCSMFPHNYCFPTLIGHNGGLPIKPFQFIFSSW